MEEEQPVKYKLTCENCVRAKIKCSGQPGPCERCSSWRCLDCVFLTERKRGRPKTDEDVRKNTLAKVNRQQALSRSAAAQKEETQKLSCVTSDCWALMVDSAETVVPVEGPAASPSSGLNYEQKRVVEIFFELYKNHASNRSCCKAWFTRQLNKIRGMLIASHSPSSVFGLVEWMNKHQILVSELLPPEQRAFVDPDSGFSLPPLSSPKGPMLKEINLLDSSPSTLKQSSVDDSASISLSYSRDERCIIKTNEKFVTLFGRDAGYFAAQLDLLFGGILPWGGDVFSNILFHQSDTMLLIRVLGFRFQSLPRMMDDKPITRTVQTSHMFTCGKADGSLIDCIVRFNHVENISFQGVGVEVQATFEPIEIQAPVLSLTPSSEQFDDLDVFFANEEQISSSSVYKRSGAEAASSEFRDEWVADLLQWVDETT